MKDSSATIARRAAGSPFKWVWVASAVLYAVMLVVTPEAATGRSIINMMPFVGMLALATLGQALVAMQRGFDFSLVGVIAVGSLVVAQLMHHGMSPLPAVAISLLAATVCGVVNGVLVSLLALTPLVATLASNSLFLGLAYLVSDGAPIQVDSGLEDFATGTFMGLANSVWVALVAVGCLLALIRLTTFGRRFVAVGSSPAAARSAGFSVTTTLVAAYALAGLCFGITGVLIAGFVGMSSLAASSTYLMSSISALLVAGGAIGGTRLSLVAAVVGAFFISLLSQFVLALGASAAVQNLIQGLVLIAAVAIPTIRLPKVRLGRVAAA